MKLPKSALRILLFGSVIGFFITNSYSQTKHLKKSKSVVSISNVDNFIAQSFNLYDKVHLIKTYKIYGGRLQTNSKEETVLVKI